MEQHEHQIQNWSALRIVLALVALVFATPALITGSQEVWQRPHGSQWIDDRVFAITPVAAVVFAVIILPGGWKCGMWWKRFLAGSALVAIAMNVAFTSGRDAALDDLKKHPEISGNSDLLASGAEPRWPWLENLGKWLDDHGIPIPSSLKSDARPQYTIWREPIDHLVESSRWHVRREFMQQMMVDPENAAKLVHDWHCWFPAVTGQDVTLSRRSEMLDWLDALSRDPSSTQRSRDAATFWMGLIVLTDADAFARWRAPVRDAMLACDDPPICYSGDVWMRVIDMLLAFDTRDEAVRLTQNLARDPILLRRALRQRMRGLHAHMPAIADEMDRLNALGILDAPTAIWVDLRHLADRQPESSEREEVFLRLRNVMAGWLIEDPQRFRKRFSNEHYAHADFSADVILEMPAETHTRLAAHAYRILQDSEHALPAAIQQALMIRNFLGDDARVALSQKLAEVMLQKTWRNIDENEPQHQIQDFQLLQCVAVWNDLTETQKQEFGKLLRIHLHGIDWDPRNHVPFVRALCRMEPMHHHIGFSEAEQLMIRMYAGSEVEYMPHHPYWWGAEIPQWQPQAFSMQTIHEVISKIITFTKTNEDLLRLDDSNDALPFPRQATNRWFGLARSYQRGGLTIEEGMMACLVQFDILGIEHLGDRLPDAMSARPHLARVLMRDPRPDRLSPWLDDEHGTLRILQFFENEPFRRTLSPLPKYLHANPPSGKIRNQIHSYFLSQMTSPDRETRLEAFRILLQMEAEMDPEKRREFRRAACNFMRNDRPTRYEMSFDYFDTLLHDRLGWIPWRDDALSAEHGWREQVAGEISFGRIIYTVRCEPTAYPTALFTHLMFPKDVFLNSFGYWYVKPYALDSPAPASAWFDEPPAHSIEHPIEPTPWQSARALHLRRPDLHFPDRGMFRPSR